MGKKIIALIGTYRKGRVIESAVSEMLAVVEAAGAHTTKIYLTDEQIEFCTNCRSCMQDDSPLRGKCPIDDHMGAILDKIDSSDGIILASPMNTGTVTAVTKRFIERFGVYARWLWGSRGGPIWRRKEFNKKAVALASCAMPSIMAKLFASGMFGTMKMALKAMGAGKIKVITLGLVPNVPNAQASAKQLENVRKAGQWLVS